MDNTNISPSNQYQPSVTPNLNNNNHYKYLFFISLFVLSAVTIYLILNNFSKKTPINISQISQITPTVTQQNSYLNATTRVNNQGGYDLVLNQNGKESIIDSTKENISIFTNISFTGSSRYLTYIIRNTGSIYHIYDIKNNKFIKDKEIDYFLINNEDSHFFTNDEKYFCFCGGGEMQGYFGKIISLADSSVKFDFIEKIPTSQAPLSRVDCSYNPTNNEIVFYYDNKSMTYDLVTGTLK